MATREKFPFFEDHVAIITFLEGKNQPRDSLLPTTTVFKGVLRVNGTSVAYYDTAGTLVSTSPMLSDFSTMYAVHAVNHILEVLGSDDRLVRETEEVAAGKLDDHAHTRITWRLGDEPITPGVPFILCGPLGIAAWRAARKVS